MAQLTLIKQLISDRHASDVFLDGQRKKIVSMLHKNVREITYNRVIYIYIYF